MAISYNRLWKQLIDHGLSKTDMMHRAKISTNVLARLSKGEPVSMDSMEKINRSREEEKVALLEELQLQNDALAERDRQIRHNAHDRAGESQRFFDRPERNARRHGDEDESILPS